MTESNCRFLFLSNISIYMTVCIYMPLNVSLALETLRSWVKKMKYFACLFSIQIIVQHLQGQVKELKGTKDALAVSKIREETLQNQVVTQ